MLKLRPSRQAPTPIQLRAIDRRGYYRSPITQPGYHTGREPGNKGRTFPPEPLTPREALALIDACGRGAAGARNRALIALMWRTGLRVGEALALLPKDVDLDEGQVRVLHGKGDKARTVGIDPAAGAIIRPWLEVRRELGAGRNDHLFCVITQGGIGRPLHSAYVRNMVKEAGKRAGIEKRCHPHGLRHTHAYELAGEGTDLRLVQRQLGHNDLAVTARYVNHLNPRDLILAIRDRAWPTHNPPADAAASP